MDAAAYYALPHLSVSYDATQLVTPLHNYLPELGFEGCVNYLSIPPLKAQRQVQIRYTHISRAAVYYYRDTPIWRLASVWHEDTPVMILRNVDPGDPHPYRFITDELAYRMMISYLFSLLVPEPRSPYDIESMPRSGSVSDFPLSMPLPSNERLEVALDFSISYYQ